jgi:Xaa-Pro aminopeptidase
MKLPIGLAQFSPAPAELREKEKRVRGLLAARNLDAVLLTRLSNFSWFTGGRDCSIFYGGEQGEAKLLITHTAKYVIAPNVEAARLAEEEDLEKQGFEFRIEPWWQLGEKLQAEIRNLHWGADRNMLGAEDLTNDIARLRFQLTHVELDRFRWLGRATADALEATAHAVRPGLTENEIAGLLANNSASREITPILILVGTDERIFRYRHPIPTDKKLERYLMLVVCARRWGLIASATRLVHFGVLDEELRRKERAVAYVDAVYINNTRIGTSLAEIFRCAAQAYADAGFPQEWQKHYQGGAAGYESREFEASPQSAEIVQEDQAYAWNPSITGTKSEDTFLLTRTGREFITMTGEWPEIPVSINGETIARPAILERS